MKTLPFTLSLLHQEGLQSLTIIHLRGLAHASRLSETRLSSRVEPLAKGPLLAYFQRTTLLSLLNICKQRFSSSNQGKQVWTSTKSILNNRLALLSMRTMHPLQLPPLKHLNSKLIWFHHNWQHLWEINQAPCFNKLIKFVLLSELKHLHSS